jgi:septum site-determining protein MinC
LQREKVEIKGSKDGFYAVFEPGLTLVHAISLLQEKLQQDHDFFENSYFTHLTSDTLSENDKLIIARFMEEHYGIRFDKSTFHTEEDNTKKDETLEEEINRRVQEILKTQTKNTTFNLNKNAIVDDKNQMKTFFVYETLRSGGDIQFDGHVVVIGDVNPGGRVTASGNIIILGYLRGIAHAGAKGDKNCFVVAERLAPIQLRIANAIAIASENNKLIEEPLIAKILNDTIVIESVLSHR